MKFYEITYNYDEVFIKPHEIEDEKQMVQMLAKAMETGASHGYLPWVTDGHFTKSRYCLTKEQAIKHIKYLYGNRIEDIKIHFVEENITITTSVKNVNEAA
jgi:allantoicase